jgi:1-acyl-sn-glycerol-3-phosphate acyltransferase
MDKKDRETEQKPRDRQSSMEQRVLLLVEALAREINPQRKVQATLQSALQRELGFDSLGLSELLLRTEKEFKVRLPEDLIARVETPADLVREVAGSGADAATFTTGKTDQLPELPSDALPESATTLTEVLAWHVEHHPDRPHILLSDGYRETDTITYRDLADAAGPVAGGLRKSGLMPRDSVGIMLPTGREFFEAFFGAILAGCVPVPLYPPMRLSMQEEHLRRQVRILENSEAAILIVPPEGKAMASLLSGQIPTLRRVVTVGDLHAMKAEPVSVERQADDLALLQYTSGSTGDPKGVMLTHANLLANIRVMGMALEASSKDVFISWLPLYHDMGLIGAWLGSLYYAAPVVIMSPLRFIVRPESWLWAIHRNSGTLSSAPNFAFELCVNKIDKAALEGLDLSSLRMISNGAEPVIAETIRKFTSRFEPYGLRPEALTPVYGLAENAVGLAFSPLGQMPVIEKIDRDKLSQEGVAAPASDTDENPMTFVSSGVPLPDNRIRIVDRMGREVAERHQGRLEFKSPSSTQGYFRDPERSKALFHDGWLDSGDLAYIANGHVFITGRIKDIIIKGGRNIYPEEIEQAVGDIEGIRKGCVAAFARPDPKTGSEQLIVVAETRSTDAATLSRLQTRVGEKVTDLLEMPADRVIIAPPHSVPKTSSGKIRRSTTRDLFETGKLGKPGRAVWMQVLRLRLTRPLTQLRHLSTIASDLIYAGWWWGVIYTVGAITWLGVLSLPNRRARWRLVRAIARTCLRLQRIPLTISGEALLFGGSRIIVSNHASYFDAVVLGAVLPDEPVFIAKQELAGQHVAGPFLRRLGARFAERAEPEAGRAEAEALKELALAGEHLVFFPEATFFREPGLLPFRLGAFSVACAADAAVLPIAIRGTRSILRGEQWFPRRGSVSVSVLDPLTPAGPDFSDAVDLRDRARSVIQANCGEAATTDRVIVFEKEGDDETSS